MGKIVESVGTGALSIACGLAAWAGVPGKPSAPERLPDNASAAGVVAVPHPTLENLSVTWAFSGDANANAVVRVRHRKLGTATWVDSMPLRRVSAGSSSGFSWPSRHAGSIFDLQPATTYEVELTLVDPDGGSAQRVVQATTRSVPEPMRGAPLKLATPDSLPAVMAAARPGDVIELTAGTYAGFEWTRDGSPGKPIVLRASKRGSAIIDGEVGIFGRRHVHLDGLTVNGRIRLNGSHAVAVMRCTVNARPGVHAGDGIVMYRRGEDAYIADNLVVGTVRWTESALGTQGANAGEGIAVTGPGHVIQNNRVTGFRDGISFMEGSEAVDQYSLDVLNNDIEVAADDGIEADFCSHNCRIMRNRIANTFVALSSQPGLGGPTYFVRNVAYNVVHVAFKLYRGSHGDVLLHNTVVKLGDALAVYTGERVSALYTRNNLVIGGPPGARLGGYETGSGKVLWLPTVEPATADMDHDAWGSEGGMFQGRMGEIEFIGIDQLRARTSMKRATWAGLDAFAARVALPSSPMTRYPFPDLRLSPSGAAVDAGTFLPGINDGFTGKAPDAGAYELGAAAPHYGPR